MKTSTLIAALFILLVQVSGQIYVAPDGDDNNPGTEEKPYKTFPKAMVAAVPGDTIFVRGGTFELLATISISGSKSGSAEAWYHLYAYPGERPLLDFSKSNFGVKGLRLQGSFWHIRGLDLKGAGDNGLMIDGGTDNIIEQCAFFENRDSGVQLANGASRNRLINCDSYYNADPTDYGDADGFAPKLDVGTDNYFYGCRAWANCDDGWDGYLRGATNVTTTLENCWTWGNGYLKDGSDPGPQANGNGFKMGGGDGSNSENLTHHMFLNNCVAFNNKVKGFDQNNNAGTMVLYNCTGYNNLTANYRVQRTLAEGESLVVKNCVSYEGLVQLGDFALQETNSWLLPFAVTADDFIDLVFEAASGPRQPDGSLPEISFLHLAQGSDLIDAGVDLGLAYNGEAPDLGAFESDYGTTVEPVGKIAANFELYQNYPNPFNPETVISWQLAVGGHVELAVYDLLGKKVATLVSKRMPAGKHTYLFDGSNLASGLYFYRLTGEGFSHVRKMIFQK